MSSGDETDLLRAGRDTRFALFAWGPGALRRGVAVALAMAVFTVPQPAAAQGLKVEPLVIVSGTKNHRFQVELALTDQEQQLGLMFRTRLPADRGMLFIYRPAQEITMWMRNTRISLDMIFIRNDGTIHRIARDTEPYSLATIASKGDVVAVLEVVAGTARRLGLKSGDRVVSKALGTKTREGG